MQCDPPNEVNRCKGGIAHSSIEQESRVVVPWAFTQVTGVSFGAILVLSRVSMDESEDPRVQ
jgi:hypothetical protein